MLTDDALELLATDLETDRIERKESFESKKDEIAQAVCAFANDLPGNEAPGYVLIGVRDDGTPSHLPITEALLLSIAALRSSGNILPLPSMTVERRVLRGTPIALVTVMPNAAPPVQYRGRIYIRTTSRRGIASRDDERILNERRRWLDHNFLDRACPDASLADLDTALFESTYLPSAVAPDVLAANNRTAAERMRALRLLDAADRPTFLALVTIGRSPRDWLPGAYVQFVRFAGDALTDPILDQKVLEGPLARVAALADDVILVNIRIETRLPDQGPEQRLPDYPAVALRELLRNALLHRSYEVQSPIYLYWFSDRIEIHSPGGLFGRVTPDNFGLAGMTDYRNPSLAAAMKTLGFVQQFGIGVALARKACLDNRNPEPRFEFGPSRVTALIESRR